jgi:hypothetical protein
MKKSGSCPLAVLASPDTTVVKETEASFTETSDMTEASFTEASDTTNV